MRDGQKQRIEDIVCIQVSDAIMILPPSLPSLNTFLLPLSLYPSSRAVRRTYGETWGAITMVEISLAMQRLGSVEHETSSPARGSPTSASASSLYLRTSRCYIQTYSPSLPLSLSLRPSVPAAAEQAEQPVRRRKRWDAQAAVASCQRDAIVGRGSVEGVEAV